MADEYEEAGTCRDVDGYEVTIGHTRSVVLIKTTGTAVGVAGDIHLGPDERGDFMRLYMAAETAAEAWAAANPESDDA